MKKGFIRSIDIRTKYYFAKKKYNLPSWVKEKEDYPLFTINEINEILNMGLHFRVNYWCGDCAGFLIRIEFVDPESGLEIEELDYSAGWETKDIEPMFNIFKEYKDERIEIKDYW